VLTQSRWESVKPDCSLAKRCRTTYCGPFAQGSMHQGPRNRGCRATEEEVDAFAR